MPPHFVVERDCSGVPVLAHEVEPVGRVGDHGINAVVGQRREDGETVAVIHVDVLAAVVGGGHYPLPSTSPSMAGPSGPR